MKQVLYSLILLGTLSANGQRTTGTLPPASSVGPTDKVLIEQGSANKTATIQQILDNITGASSTLLGYVNAADYGVDSDNTGAENEDAAETAQTNAALLGKGLAFPSGTLPLDEFDWNPNVPLKGAGKRLTILQSTTATPLIRRLTGTQVYPTEIKDLCLDGNNIGTVGLELTELSQFNFEHLLIKKFTQYGAKVTGLLSGVWQHVWFWECQNGIKSYPAAVTNNLNRFINCFWYTIPGIGLDWTNSEGLQLIGCNMEVCGTNGNAATGAIKVKNMNSGGSMVATIFERCWLERNRGGFGILFDTAAAPSINVFRDGCNFFNNTEGSLDNAIVVNNDNHLVLETSKIGDAGYGGIKIDGANAKVFYRRSAVLGTTTTLNGGTIENETP